ncbi:MAG: hypothetical protein JW715_11310 [Sedimentisphaerales bacterium]|nr:hypothetical protein [Sedimentisphaerales bacterium]
MVNKMRLFRKFTITEIIFELIFLGAFIVLLITALLFWDESGDIKTLGILALAIIFVTIRLYLSLNVLKSEESFYIENTRKRLLFQRKASEERRRIQQLQEEVPKQIHAGLNRVLTSSLLWMRMLHSKKLIGLFFYIIIPFVFWFIFNFRWHLSIVIGLIAAFLIESIVQMIVRYRIAALFEKEFPAGSPERAAAIEHLFENRHAYWFASELLKVVGQ